MNSLRKLCVMGVVEVVELVLEFGEGPWPLTEISSELELSPKTDLKDSAAA